MIKGILITLLVITLFPCSLLAQTANRFDIVIDELFPDPSPVIGLPNSEFIELKNVSSFPINLRNWKISDGTTNAFVNINFILQPDSFVIVCSSSSAALYTSFGSAIGVSSFPSLNNDADNITLYSPEGKVIHAVGYNTNWYQSDLKKEGGWTLEMMDCKNPCGGADNWGASINNKGGTPGITNSIDVENKDEQFPALLRTYTIDSMTLVAEFDESLDSNIATIITNYQIDKNIGSPHIAIPVGPLFTEVILKLNKKMNTEMVYQLIVGNLTDCSGNLIGTMNKAKVGLPVLADTNDIIINELLFNPTSDGYDYVEFYNRSKQVIDCNQLYVANLSITGSVTSIRPFITTSWLLFPGEYLVLTENKKWLQQNYTVKNPSQVMEITNLPSLPDDKGTILLLNVQGKFIDQLSYNQQWHFALIDNKQGIALERIDDNQPTQLKSNWTSAASTAGFGTPGYQNSQFRADVQVQGQIHISPEVFSPDNDGIDDFAFINYQFAEPNYVANINIFDISGRMIRALVRNATLSATGSFRWDGLNDLQQRLSVGPYIIVTEIFNLNGKTKRFKNVVTVARKF